ncbi:hypothetical protein L6164_031885 [Bauhinia variegata]|uniref:Uncharacterized protein n=1 Tax=Bauhinia variegata TaxID=167791 RepID=A0ACB9KMB9_BAUVA|nr:hypothetical protein L6164_031885 [Bauhinia variegata]
MGLVLLKKFSILFLLVSASLLATCFSGPRSKFVSELAGDVDTTPEEGESMEPTKKEEVMVIHERLLRDNTKDYGRYDPSPKLSKPPFKLIPN